MKFVFVLSCSQSLFIIEISWYLTSRGRDMHGVASELDLFAAMSTGACALKPRLSRVVMLTALRIPAGSPISSLWRLVLLQL